MAIYTCSLVIFCCLSLHITHATSRQSKCPEELQNCSCSPERLACDLRGFTRFPENIYPEYGIQDLSLSQNNLTEINDNQLRFFTHLRYLNLRNNKIATVSGGAFCNNRMTHTIDLSMNRLSSLPISLFKCLKLLEDVYLGENQLKVIESAHFGGLVNLKKIRLHDNQLKKVGSDAFLDSPGITELYLENNQLETPERNWLLHFDYTEPNGYELYLDGNPWSCDCRMKRFYDWAIKKKWLTSDPSRMSPYTGVTIPRCYSPERLKGLRITSLDSSNKLKCSGVNVTSKSSNISILEGESLVLECQVSGFPIPTVSLVDPQGIILSSNANAVKYIRNDTSVSDSGLYRCHASGYRNSNEMISVDSVITVEVKKSKSRPILLIVGSVCLLAFLVLLGLGALCYKRRRPDEVLVEKEPPNDAKVAEKKHEIPRQHDDDLPYWQKDTEYLV